VTLSGNSLSTPFTVFLRAGFVVQPYAPARVKSGSDILLLLWINNGTWVREY
jgi:hypothetical protein